MSNTHQPENQGLNEEAIIAALAPISREDMKSGARVAQALQARMTKVAIPATYTVIPATGWLAGTQGESHRQLTWSRYLRIAAAVVIAIVGIRYFSQAGPAAAAFKTYATSPAQRAKITLADGSTVLLAPATTIRYAEDFGKSNRNIELDGQALFTVTHASGVPFTIKISNAQVRVLGTSFTVRKYSNDSDACIVVAEGKVSLADAVLTSGDAGTVTQTGELEITRSADIARELSWTNGRLHFADARLGDVLPELSRWYGVKFSAHQSLLNAPVTAAFDVESPQQAADILKLVLRARATRTADGFMLNPSNPAKR